VARRPASHAHEVGLEEVDARGWHHWVGLFTPNEMLPGEPLEATTREQGPLDLALRGLRLVEDFLTSLAAHRRGARSGA
jgi:hypothetical protein